MRDPVPVEVSTRQRTGISRSRASLVAFLVGVAIVSAGWILLITPSGPVVGPDSAAYIGGAENFASGRGITLPFVPRGTEVSPLVTAKLDGRAPLYQYSPLLSAMLAPAVRAGADARWAALYLNAVLCAIATVLVAWAIVQLAGRYVPAVLGVLFLLSTEVFLYSFTSVSTEALFLPLVLAALAVLARYLVAPDWRVAGVFVVLAAAAALARIVGVTVIATGVLAVLVWSQPRPRQIWRALVIGAAACVPVVAWSVYQSSTGDLGGVGELAWHPPPLFAGLSGAIDTWLTGTLLGDASEAVRTAVFVVVVLLAVGGCWWAHRTGMFRSPSERSLVRVGWLFPVVYVPFLYLTIAVVVASTPFGLKYLVPVLPPLLVLAVAGAWKLLIDGARAPIIALAVALVVIVPVAVRHADAARQVWETGRSAVETPAFAGSGSGIDALSALSSGSIVFTNNPEGVNAATGLFAIALPPTESVWTGQRNERYREQLEEIGLALCRHPGVVFISSVEVFGSVDVDPFGRAAGLDVVGTYPDGTVLAPSAATCE